MFAFSIHRYTLSEHHSMCQLGGGCLAWPAQRAPVCGVRRCLIRVSCSYYLREVLLPPCRDFSCMSRLRFRLENATL